MLVHSLRDEHGATVYSREMIDLRSTSATSESRRHSFSFFTGKAEAYTVLSPSRVLIEYAVLLDNPLMSDISRPSFNGDTCVDRVPAVVDIAA